MGRPRKYQPGEEPPARVRQERSRAALAARGGKELKVRLESEEVQALDRLKSSHNFETDTAAIAFAITQAARRAR